MGFIPDGWRRSGLVLLAAVLSVLALPVAAAVLGAEDARHLLNRTSFAADAADVQAFARLTREAAVDRLLGWTTLPMRTAPPAWTSEPYSPPPVFKQMTEEERQAYRRKQIEQGRDLRAWWVSEMLTTGSPQTEKMVLFWHNHFTSSLRKVRLPLLMYRQHMTLRQHALGHFGDMLHAMARDPAMLIYLDGTGSGKGKPNENFARELLELFTLGEGRYTEQDVKAAARAFTGWGVSPRSGGFVVRPALHDDGVKTFLGVTGAHDGAAVLDILLGRPETAEWIVSKLWREFVSPEPDVAEVKRIAARFRASRYDIRVALRALLTSEAFYAPQARATLIKSPADLIVGTFRLFRVGVDDALPYALTMGYLGQDLFTPPNVKGWPGGEAWINSTTLLVRKRFLEQVFRQSMSGEPVKTAMMAMPDPGDVKARARRAVAALRFDGPGGLAQTRGAGTDWRVLVFPQPPVTPVTGDDVMALRQAVLDPVFQLKLRMVQIMRTELTRRHFLKGAVASGLALGMAPLTVWSQAGAVRSGRYDRLLILIELKGGNDGLNTVVPYADPRYASLRPRLAIPADQVHRLDGATGLHPALAPLMPLWQRQELAVLQSVGYVDANLSHFRSIEIWETASGSHEYLPDGWLARVFRQAPAPTAFAADAVIIGSGEMGPFAGGARAVALNDTERFARDAMRVQPHEASGRGALGHLLKVEREVAQAGNRLGSNRSFRTTFPTGAFGNALRTAAQVMAGPHGVAAIRVTLNGFDTHRGQPAVHANLLKALGEGMAALREVLIELGRWDSTLVLTYSEFGRRAAENRSQGTDHGTANAHFAMGGRVRGGLHGLPPALDRLDANGNIPYAIDFKDIYGTILADWWGLDPAIALGGKRQAVPLLKV